MDQKETTRRFYEEIFNEGHVEKLADYADPGFVDHNPDPGQEPTLQGAIEGFRQMKAAFPDVAVTVHDMVSEGDQVVARVTISGTHKGEFAGIAATGKSIAVGLIDWLRFRDGKVVERWGQYDAMGMMQQLGVTEGPP